MDERTVHVAAVLGETRPLLPPAMVAACMEAFAAALPEGACVILKLTENCYGSDQGVRDVVCTAGKGARPVHVWGMRYADRTLTMVLDEAFGVERADTGERLFTKRVDASMAYSHLDSDLWVEGCALTALWCTKAGGVWNTPSDKHAKVVADPCYELLDGGKRVNRWTWRFDGNKHERVRFKDGAGTITS
jgi:hypothetical protein